jgi:MFS family permease
MFLFLTLYFQINLQYSPLKAGFAFLPFSGGIIISAGVAAQLLPRVGPRPLLLTGLTMAVAGMLWLTRLEQTSSYATHVLPSELIISLGMALVFIPASSTALVGIGGHDAGIASAILNTSQQIGGSLGTALLNTLFASAVTGYVKDHAAGATNPAALRLQASIHGYTTAFFWGAVLLFASLVAAAVFINARKQDVPAEPAMVPA